MTTLAAFRSRAPRPVAPPPNRAVRLEGAAKQVIDSSRGRLTLAAGVFAIAFAVVGMRLVDLATSKPARARNTAHDFPMPRLAPDTNAVRGRSTCSVCMRPNSPATRWRRRVLWMTSHRASAHDSAHERHQFS